MIDDTLVGKIILAEQLVKNKTISKAPKAMLTVPRVTITKSNEQYYTVLEISGPIGPNFYITTLTRKIAQLGLQINSASVSPMVTELRFL